MVAVASGVVTPLAESPFPHDVTIFNTGAATVYLSDNTSVTGNPAQYGIPVPPQTYKDWRAGTTCFATCAEGESSTVTVGQHSGLLSAPIGQGAVTLLNDVDKPLTQGTAYDTPVYDVSRYPSFSYIRTEYQTAFYVGFEYRTLTFSWYVKDGGGNLVLVNTDVHTIMICGSGLAGGLNDEPSRTVIRGDVVAPYLQISESAQNAPILVDSVVSRNLTGYISLIGVRSNFYTNGASSNGTFSPIPAPTGVNGHWCYEITLGSGGTTDIYPAVWTGATSLHARVRGAVTGGDGILFVVTDVTNTRQLASIDLDPGTGKNDSDWLTYYTPTAATKVRINNDSTVSLGVTLSATYARTY